MVKLGVDCFLESIPASVNGARVGLISNYTVVDGGLRATIDRFLACSSFRLTTLFGPEHGVKNSAREGEQVEFAIDAHSGLAAYSLYGSTRKPTPEMLADVDMLVLDLQDIGSRYYTNMNTMALAMEAAQENDLPLFVLDRPNPIGGSVQEGNILEPECQSFVGGGPMPNRHGMTIGELARWFGRLRHQESGLTVVPMQGWERHMFWEETGLPFVSPSPNTTHIDMTLLYPGTCLFEGTNLSLGRGTTHPFEVIGAPFIDGHRLAEEFNLRGLSGVRARATYFVPQSSAWQGQSCAGVQLYVIDRQSFRPVEAALVLIMVLRDRYPSQFAVVPGHADRASFFQLLSGTKALESWLSDDPGAAIAHYLDQGSDAWGRFRRQFEDARLY